MACDDSFHALCGSVFVRKDAEYRGSGLPSSAGTPACGGEAAAPAVTGTSLSAYGC